jgi:hypothetical protein
MRCSGRRLFLGIGSDAFEESFGGRHERWQIFGQACTMLWAVSKYRCARWLRNPARSIHGMVGSSASDAAKTLTLRAPVVR